MHTKFFFNCVDSTYLRLTEDHYILKQLTIIIDLNYLRSLYILTTQHLKKKGRSMVSWLVRLFNCCFETGRLSKDWCTECIVPLYKRKVHKCESCNSKSIKLLSAFGTLYGRVLIDRTKIWTDGVLRPGSVPAVGSRTTICTAIYNL